jgi:ApbE superfamily uncharacterized protein (UPF0280 family)
MRLSARRLPDGRRLHVSDGPIDLIVQAWGDAAAVAAAEAAAVARAAGILDELCAELPLLRAAATPAMPAARGSVARRMQDAVRPHAARAFITPMAAVAGAVAEAVLAAMERPGLRRAVVNNGGDIALFLAPGEWLTAGLVDDPERGRVYARTRIAAGDAARGIATSGWRGRSHSLGIADAVTVLATTAAAADAAATIIANAVDLPGHPAITRIACRGLDPESDLGDRAVTKGVGTLPAADIDVALDRGADEAGTAIRGGLAVAAALRLGGRTRVVGEPLRALAEAGRPMPRVGPPC